MEAIYSKFISPIAIPEGQYEGYQYFGLGIIALLIFVTLLNIQKYKTEIWNSSTIFFVALLSFPFLIKQGEPITMYERVALFIFLAIYFMTIFALYKQKEKWLLLLSIPATLCYLYALSNIVVLGNTTIYTFSISDEGLYGAMVATMRSSGRLFWLTSQFLVLAGLILMYRNVNSWKKSVFYLIIIISIQCMDLSKLSYRIDSKNREHLPSHLDEDSKNMILKASAIRFMSDYDMHIGSFALLHKVSINKFYTVHGTGKLTEKKLAYEDSCFKNLVFNPQDLYLFTLNNLPINRTMEIKERFSGGYFAIPSKLYRNNDSSSVFITKIKSDSLETIVNLIKKKPLVILSIKDEGTAKLSKSFTERFDGIFHSRLSKVGFRNSYLAVFKDGSLVSDIVAPEGVVEYSGFISNKNIYVKSSSNESIIRINDINFSLNERGINYVAVDSTHKVRYETGNFDTYEINYPF
jgi:hypothetical protein